jgi:exosortase
MSTGPLSGHLLSGRIPVRALAVVAAVSLAYHYSLLTLARGVGLQTPLAYLAFVPLIAIALGWVALRREPVQRPIHDRQLDYIVGLALIVFAAALAWLLPTTLAARFWMYRVDLLSLPIFAAGIVTLLYGLRSVWTLRFPLGFLLLAWPVPYLPLVGDGIRAFVDATSVALTALTHVIPIATAVPGDDTFFFVKHNDELFPLSVSSACSGVNGLVGFILVGGALAYVVDGRLLRRLVWLASGLVLIWALNIARIELIFVAGALFGQHVAIEILHPVAGLLVFNLGVFAMLLAVPRFGLAFVPLSPAVPAPAVPTPRVRQLRGALVVSAVLAIVVGVANAGYARYEAIVDSTGSARLTPFDVRTARVPDWETALVATYEEGKPFFGQSSTWDRMLYSSTPRASLRSSVPIYVDAIDTEDFNSFAAYGLEACYRFHGYRVEFQGPVDVGRGVSAAVIDYHGPKDNVDWTALWWEWPYHVGAKTMYQRVVLFVANGPNATYAGAPDDAEPAQAARFRTTNAFLATLARGLVATHLDKAQVP